MIIETRLWSVGRSVGRLVVVSSSQSASLERVARASSSSSSSSSSRPSSRVMASLAARAPDVVRIARETSSRVDIIARATRRGDARAAVPSSSSSSSSSSPSSPSLPDARAVGGDGTTREGHPRDATAGKARARRRPRVSMVGGRDRGGGGCVRGGGVGGKVGERNVRSHARDRASDERRGGAAPTEAAGAAAAHRATTNPLFLRMAFKRVESAYGGDVEAAKASEAWGKVRMCVTTASKVVKRNGEDSKDAKAAKAEARRREARERIGAFVCRGKELLALERARELEDTAVGALITEDADDADVETAVAAVADAGRDWWAPLKRGWKHASGVALSVEDDIALGALKVGDRVKISTYTAPDDATVDGSVDVERLFCEARCVSWQRVE